MHIFWRNTGGRQGAIMILTLIHPITPDNHSLYTNNDLKKKSLACNHYQTFSRLKRRISDPYLFLILLSFIHDLSKITFISWHKLVKKKKKKVGRSPWQPPAPRSYISDHIPSASSTFHDGTWGRRKRAEENLGCKTGPSHTKRSEWWPSQPLLKKIYFNIYIVFKNPCLFLFFNVFYPFFFLLTGLRGQHSHRKACRLIIFITMFIVFHIAFLYQ